MASNVPFPTTLDGVQVLVNGVAAPIYYMTPDADFGDRAVCRDYIGGADPGGEQRDVIEHGHQFLRA